MIPSHDDDTDTITEAKLSDHFTQPHHDHGSRGQTNHGNKDKLKKPGLGTKAPFSNLADHVTDDKRLKNTKNQGGIASVLVDLATTTLTIFLQLLDGGNHGSKNLEKDRCRDIGHDTQSKNGSIHQSSATEHVDHAHHFPNTGLLIELIKEVVHGAGIDARKGDEDPHPIDDQVRG